MGQDIDCNELDDHAISEPVSIFLKSDETGHLSMLIEHGSKISKRSSKETFYLQVKD